MHHVVDDIYLTGSGYNYYFILKIDDRAKRLSYEEVVNLLHDIKKGASGVPKAKKRTKSAE